MTFHTPFRVFHLRPAVRTSSNERLRIVIPERELGVLLTETIDIPSGAHDKAESRYRDLGEWFNRTGSECQIYGPHIYSQGSFRLGTVVRPVTDRGEYDLDVGCRLTAGLSSATHSQEAVKHLVGRELSAYRRARGIDRVPEEKRRCWRLSYADDLSFHMDVVPSIPNESARLILQESMVRTGTAREIAVTLAHHSGAVTDNEDPGYRLITPNWRISNSEGYALWFESRMKLAPALLQERATAARAASIDKLPARNWRSPLQAAVKILKRHRDVMFENASDAQPISIIITTLAGRAYNGEQTVAEAIRSILLKMDAFIASTSPRVPNPVNPSEDFADKWSEPAKAHLRLEATFRLWLERAKVDFDGFLRDRNPAVISERLNSAFKVRLAPGDVAQRLGLGMGTLAAVAAGPAVHSFPSKPIVPNKPGGFA